MDGALLGDHGVLEGDRHSLTEEPQRGTGTRSWFPWCLLRLLVMRLPVSYVSSVAISCHTPAVSTAKG